MDQTIHKRLEGPMEELAQSSRGIRACLLATVDGVAISERNCEDHAEALAALAASSLGIGRRVTDVTDCGTLDDVCFKGFDGTVSIVAVGNKAVLAVIAYEGASVGMVMYHARKCATSILEIIDPDQARTREEREDERYDEQFNMRSALQMLGLAANEGGSVRPDYGDAATEEEPQVRRATAETYDY